MVAVQAAAAAAADVVVVVVVVELGWGGVATPYGPARLINESRVEWSCEWSGVEWSCEWSCELRVESSCGVVMTMVSCYPETLVTHIASQWLCNVNSAMSSTWWG